MAEKVKVSQDVADAIEYMRERLTDANIIDARYDEKFQFALEGQPLNDVPPLELTKIILNGYEIEQTPEDILLKYYEAPSIPRDYFNNFNSGMKFALDTLGIKIKGINE